MLNALRSTAPAIPFPNAIPVLPSSKPAIPSPWLVPALQRRVESYLAAAHHHRRSHPPLNPDRFPHWDVTPMNEMGVKYAAYNVNGELMVKVTPVVPDAQSSWYHVGKMPR